MNPHLKLCIDILKYATKNKTSLNRSCIYYKKNPKYFSDFLRRGLIRGVRNGKISTKEHEKFIQLHENYQKITNSFGIKTSKNLNTKISDDIILNDLYLENEDDISNITNISLTKEEQEQIEYDAYKDDKYDERSLGESIKDAEGKIIEYHYKILIRDQEPLEGIFTREEMDKIYRLYSNLDGAGLTLRAVSREFHNLNFRDFKRILRAFNITKSSIPVAPHILLERDPNDVAEIILRNKENILLKKLDNERSKIIEKHFINTQKKLLEYQKTDEWIGNVIDRYLNEYSNNNNLIKNYNFKVQNLKNNKNKSNPTIAIFGDIHYGKRFDNPVLGRAYNKEIAHERVMQIAKNAIEDYNLRNSKEIILICVGDLVESIMEDGMHAGHVYEMDLFQEEQIFFALDSLKAMLIYVLENSNCPIQFHAVQGNHDRIGIGRDQDKNRTAGKIICKFLEREFNKQSDKITFNIPKNNLLRIITGNLMLFTQHGDSSLSKKKPSDIVNLQGEPGCYSVLIQGHWHSLKSEEGNNYLAIKIPSVASTDKFILEELGNNNLSGFIIGYQPEDCYGFNYSKITLK